MKISHIKVQSVLGVHHVDLELNRPVTLVAGLNGAGKSSLRAAIRMAMTGKPGERVELKKDFGKLVTEGAKSGTASVWIDGEHAAQIKLPSGEHGESLPAVVNIPRLNTLLEPALFARLKADERRQFLFDLMGLSLDPQVIAKRLQEKGCDAKKVEIIRPMLRTGFAGAQQDAGSRMTEAKGAWRGVTGETWGANKAEGWAVPAQLPPATPQDITALETAVAQRQQQLDHENQVMGGLLSKIRAAETNEASINGLKAKAGQIERIKTKLGVDDGELAKWNKALAEVISKASTGTKSPNGGECECPVCGEELRYSGGRLSLRIAEIDHEDARLAASKIPEYERATSLLQSAVNNDKRDLRDAEAAQAQLDLMTQTAMAVPSDIDLKKQSDLVSAAKQELSQFTTQLNEARAAALAAAAASTKTRTAAGHHADVLHWQAISEALSPAGIPAEILSSALRPLNNLLRSYAEQTAWKQVAIDADMNLLADGRLYTLLSESEQWRADAMIGAAIAELSGIKMLVLDRIDVLDLAARGALIMWLDTLAGIGHLDTAMIFGTFKALPTGLPDNCEAFWIESGVIAGQQQVAA